ncbi:MAG TPA: class I SAM-dependent methyltransferase family protein [Candidatus Nanoarchaeia archaeon]|nr:class I SAM-dependent methyltransferase family protein [Candidatus Nanoarchaeia archaeon]
MNLREQMQGIIPDSLLPLVPNRFDIIGDLVVISIPPELDDYKTVIAKNIVLQHGNIKNVLNKVAMLDGDNRVGRFDIILGDSTHTVHREYGYRYRLDVRKVFFTPRLSFERRRVASLVRSSEHVLIPFCGVGPFAVPAAAKGAKVVAIEKNVAACKWLAENTKLNKVEENISIILGDALKITNLIESSFDRAIVPTPYGLHDVLDKISVPVKEGGIIHFYTFQKLHKVKDLLEEYQNSGFDVVFYRKCGNVAPKVSRWVFDLKKQ